MPEVLELAHLVQDDGMAQVQVRRGRVEPRLHAQGLALGQLADEVLLDDQFMDAAPDDVEAGLLTH